MPIEILKGDITQRGEDAIVNAANEALLPGGGVCGAIHRVAGPDLEKACRAIGRCPTGSAVITPGFGLKARHVIHAVGPVWKGGDAGEAALLASCYRSIFALVRENGLKSVALPAVSTGIYGYPLEEATDIALRGAVDFQKILPDVLVVFVCFDDRTNDVYKQKSGALRSRI